MKNIILKTLLMTIFAVSNKHISVFGFESTQQLNFEYNFTSQHPHIKLKEGFSGFEKWGTWTDGKSASLSIDLGKILLNSPNNLEESDYSLTFLAHAFLPTKESKVVGELMLS